MLFKALDKANIIRYHLRQNVNNTKGQPVKTSERTTSYPGIYRMGDNRFQIRVANGKDPITGRHKQKTINFRGTLSEARARQSQLQTQTQGHSVSGSDWTVSKLMAEYFKHVDDKQSPTTLDTDLGRWEIIKNGLGPKRVTSVTAMDIDMLLDAIQKHRKVKPQTVNRYRTLLSGAFEKAVRWNVISENPVRKTSARTDDPFDPELIDIDLVQYVFDAYAVHDPRVGDFLQLALLNSLRRAEVCGIQSRDYDAETKTLRIRRAVVKEKGKGGKLITKWPKNRQPRLLDLDDTSIEIIERYLSDDEAFLFSDDDGVTPWRPSRVTCSQRRMRERVCSSCGHVEKIGVKICSECFGKVGCYFRIHDLRAWMTTFLLEKNLSKPAQNRGGWRDEMTMRSHYNRSRAGADTAAVDAINERFRKPAADI